MSSVSQLHRELEWNVEADGDAVVARLSGSAGFHQVTELERCAKAIAKQQRSLVVLELSQLKFISSVGMGAMIALKRSIEALSGKVQLAGLSPAIAGVFQAAGLDNLFEICVRIP